jgi:Zn finger protein HypA/HybF involved in hydrogenase expression
MSGNAHNKGKPAKNKLSAEVRLSMGSPFDHRTPAHKLRRALFEIGVEYVCKQCNMPPLWRGEPITLEVDHIDECYWNNTRENLQFLCPNCHAQKTASTTNRTS